VKPTMKLSGQCDLCGTPLADPIGADETRTYVDGRTKMGPWADMCEPCFTCVGVGLGTGRGQRYNAHTGEKVTG
jgi:hypothetical protein